MTRFLCGVARSIAESFPLPEPIVEIGSYQVDGQEELIDLRGLFPGRDYIGVDFRAGPGVDRVADVEDLPFADRSIGTVLAFSTFEHVRRFWLGFEEVRRVLKPDGVFVVACPFYFHQHAYPSDYWRFTPQAFESLLADYPTRILGWHGPERRPLNVWAIGFGEDYAGPTAEQFEEYRERLTQNAHEPISRVRQVRYGLARLISGRRPFSVYFDRNRWDTELQTEPLKRAA